MKLSFFKGTPTASFVSTVSIISIAEISDTSVFFSFANNRSIFASQVISNVPAAVLLSAFTDSWRELLAGVNIGGLGTPIASLASLITLKLYLRWPVAKIGKFLAVFTVANVAGLALLLGFALLT